MAKLNEITTELKLTPLPPEEAMAFFGTKVDISAAEFYSMAKEVRSLAFTVSRVAEMDILSDIHDAVQAAIDDGETLADFMSRLGDIMETEGWSGLTPWHAENVFRTNILTSYSVGHENEYSKYSDDFPYAQYDAVDDDRVRDNHAALDGKIYPVDDPFWDDWTPPNGYQCRCQKRYIHKYEIEERGLKVSAPISDIKPDKGFDYNPAKEQWTPDEKDYVPELWRQFKAEQKGVNK